MSSTDNFPSFAEEFEANEVKLNKDKFLKLLNKTRISISNDDTRHYLNGVFIHITEAHEEVFLLVLLPTVIDFPQAVWR